MTKNQITPMTEQEKTDLATMQEKCNQIRKSAFSAMLDCSRLTETELKHTGYKTIEAAVLGRFKYYSNQCDTLMKEHFMKYPD